MAIQKAIKKCKFYLRGLPTFDVLTDHRPLVEIFRKQLSMLENNRLMRMREKIIEFTFEVSWVEGKTHYIADALSRVRCLPRKKKSLQSIAQSPTADK